MKNKIKIDFLHDHELEDKNNSLGVRNNKLNIDRRGGDRHVTYERQQKGVLQRA